MSTLLNYLLHGSQNQQVSTVDAPGYEPVEGETIPRRNYRYADKLLDRLEDDMHTVLDVVQWGVRKFGNARKIGYRDLIKVHTEKKKVTKKEEGQEKTAEKDWKYFEMSEYRYLSFVQYEQLMLQVGAGLRKLGLVKNDRIHLYAGTSHRWLAMMHGATSQTIPVVTSYETLGEDALKHAIDSTEPKLIYTEPQLLKQVAKMLESRVSLQYVVYNDTPTLDQELLKNLKNKFNNVQFLSFEDLRTLGEKNPVEPVRPTADDLCCIMYTSGSTGAPKGVLIKHSTFVAAVTGATAVVGRFLEPTDSFIAYLPLAHIFELMVETSSFIWGNILGYGSPRTLVSDSMRNCKGDLEEFRPTIMVGVPAVWETLRKSILGKLSKGGPIVSNVFWAAYYGKRALLQRKLPGTSFVDSYIFKKVKDATGGRLRFTMSGAGPIHPETLEFVSVVLGPMINGYGLTETTAMTALRDPMFWPHAPRGNIPPCVEIKLVDFKEAGYCSTNNPPQGEIWVRGAAVMDGYFNNEKETKATMTDDGWFKTGDVGQFDPDGMLRVIDRKKSLVKTLNGEYIALEKLESTYRTVPVVSKVCIFADTRHVKPIAIVVPNEHVLASTAKKNGIDQEHLDDLVKNEKLRNIVLKELRDAATKSGLSGIEIIQGIILVSDEWTPENQLVTAAEKLNRRGISEKYQQQINDVYEKSSDK